MSIRSSVKRDHVVCLEDGKKMKMLKRHLMTDHGLTPDEYRARWGLASDAPVRICRHSSTRRSYTPDSASRFERNANKPFARLHDRRTSPSS